jgi:hypothetical protein
LLRLTVRAHWKSNEAMQITTVNLHLTQEEEKRILNEGTRHVFRDAPMARAWDTFQVDGRRYEIIDVSERSLNTIADRYYRMEHCSSPDEFIRAWKAGNSGRWDPERMLYIHWFRDVTSAPGTDLI